METSCLHVQSELIDTMISILLASCCHLNLHDVYGMLSTQVLQLGLLLSTTR